MDDKNLPMTTVEFNRNYDKITKVIPFNPDWKNGTGYFDGAVAGPDMVQLVPGEMAKSYDEDTRRKVIFISTFLGPIAVFERYTDGDGGVHTYNAARLLEATRIIPTGRLSYDTLVFLFTGGHNGKPYNLEGYLRNLKRVLNDPNQIPYTEGSGE